MWPQIPALFCGSSLELSCCSIAQAGLLTFFSRRYFPFAVCGLLLLLDVALPRFHKIAEKTGRFQMCWRLSVAMTRFRRRTDAEPQEKPNDFANDLL
jgi:hypothetical protein